MGMIELEKLPEAPWTVENLNGVRFLKSGGRTLQMATEKSEGCKASMEFAALARSAFDVMMRRGDDFVANRLGDGKWKVDISLLGLAGTESYADPFTALVEADRWYRENVEEK